MEHDKWIEQQKIRILKNIRVDGPHNCWICDLGGVTRKYSSLSIRLPWEGDKKTESTHKYSYMLHNKKFHFEDGEEVSHRCHQRHCVNPEHLSLESKEINRERNMCRHENVCQHHTGKLDCLL